MKTKTAKKILHLMFELGAALDGSTALVKDEEPEDEEQRGEHAFIGAALVGSICVSTERSAKIARF